MLCNKCHRNEAIFHSTTIINGCASEEHLCSDCVDDNKFKSFDGFMQDFLASPLEFLFPQFVAFDDYVPIEMIERESRYDRYANYKDVLNQAMESIRIGVDSATQLSPKEIDLRQKLADAVDKEEYEIASQIKKELDSLRENKKED